MLSLQLCKLNADISLYPVPYAMLAHIFIVKNTHKISLIFAYDSKNFFWY